MFTSKNNGTNQSVKPGLVVSDKWYKINNSEHQKIKKKKKKIIQTYKLEKQKLELQLSFKVKLHK